MMLFCIFLSDLLKGRNNEVTKVANYMKLFEKIKREIQLLEAGEGPAINGKYVVRFFEHSVLMSCEKS